MCCRGDQTNLAIINEVTSYDHNIIGLGQTLVITPQIDLVRQAFCATGDVRFIHDSEIIDAYPILGHKKTQLRGWYFQQLLKWCAMDMLTSERYMIQDSDSYLTVRYDPFADDRLNFICKPNPGSPDGWGKAETYAALLHRYPATQNNCITEFCPYTWDAWCSLKHRIESIHATDWLTAVINVIADDWHDFEGFFEYHIMVNHAVHQKINHTFLPLSYTELDYPSAPDLKKDFQRIVYNPTVDRNGDAVV
jgi:hypothetical protein